MKELSYFVLMPLMTLLIAAAFSDKLREKALSMRGVSALEARLSMNGRLYWVAFWLCMAAGVLVRCYRFGELPRGLNQDGTMAGVEAYCLLTEGVDQYGTSWPTYFRAWGFSQMSTLYSYLLIPFIRIMGLNRFVLRLPMLLVSVATLPLMWDFARRIVGKGYALLVLFVLAVNPWHVLQSRWALEANLMPHVLLFAIYLLYIGMERRWALYLSMVFFALTPYAYGMASFTVPVFLSLAALGYLGRHKIRLPQAILCAAIFAAIAWPYFFTLLINAVGMSGAMIGPFTMPYFEDSLRTNDIALTQWHPYLISLSNIPRFFDTFLPPGKDECYNVIDWAHTMYRFTPPLLVFGAYRIWRDRRDLTREDSADFSIDGALLVLLWLLAAAFGGMMVGGVVNRNNSVFYPLMLVMSYALWRMGKRMRVALAVAVAIFTFAFGALCISYFTDEAYQNEVGLYFHDGLQQVMTDIWSCDCDTVYLPYNQHKDSKIFMTSQLMFAQKISFNARMDQIELTGPNGEKTGRFFSERYRFVDYSKFTPDPQENAVYLIDMFQKELFDPEQYLFVDYNWYAAVYPRYWAKEEENAPWL